MAVLLALGITVALPQSASATVVGWKVTDWCAPIACTPNATYYDGMARTTFTTNAGTDCTPAVIGVNRQNNMLNGNGGYLNPPEGMFNSDKVTGGPNGLTGLRWEIGEPLVCKNGGPTLADWSIQIPFRYFKYDPSGPWVVPAATGTFELGGGICADYTGTGCVEPSMRLQCLNGTSVLNFDSTGTQAMSGSSASVSSYTGVNQRTKTLDGKRSIVPLIAYPGATTALTGFRTFCPVILSLTLTHPTDTIGGFKVVQWSAARASNGVANTWDPENISNLNCNVQTPPQECIGSTTTPYLISCGKVTIDPGTWGNLGPCIFGTPSDYIRGIGALDEVMDMPLPGTGSCSPFNAGTMFDTPVVFDLCGWYPAARPVFDVLMTAGLWIAVVGSVFKTRSGENN